MEKQLKTEIYNDYEINFIKKNNKIISYVGNSINGIFIGYGITKENAFNDIKQKIDSYNEKHKKIKLIQT